MLSTDNTAKKASGWGEGLPSYVHDRMKELGLRPSLRQLAVRSGVTTITLYRNFHGERAMHWETAKKLSAALEVSLDVLAEKNLVI